MKRSTIIGLCVVLASMLTLSGFGFGCLFMLMLPSNGPPPIAVNPIRAAVSPALTAEQKAVRDYLAYNYEADRVHIVEESKPVFYKKGGYALVRLRYKMPSGLHAGMLVLDEMVLSVRNGKAERTSLTYEIERYSTRIFDKGESPDNPDFDYNQDN